MGKYDVIVIGGGISGMSYAHYASKANLSVLVLEKKDLLGGSFQTEGLMGNRDDFWVEMGAHTCYNSYGNLIAIMEDCGIVDSIIPRAKVPFRLLIANQIKSFPSQINFLELIISIPKLLYKKKVGETVKSYYGGIVGQSNFRKVFSALFSAVPSQKADDFPADMLFKKRERRKDIIKHFTLKRGLKSLIEGIATQGDFEIKYGVETSDIKKSDGDFKVITNHGEFQCRKLAVCTSILATQELVRMVLPKLADKLASIAYQKIESFGVIVSRDATTIKLFAGLVPTDDDFFSVISRDTVPDSRYRGFTFHFKPGILSTAQKMDKVCQVLRVSQDQIIEHHEKLNIVPSLRLGHHELIDGIDRLLDGGNLFLSGNYFAGLSIEDCVSRSKSEVERMVKE